MLSILLVLQLLCSIMIHYFKWQNFLVSCLSSELFTVVIDLNIHCLLLFFPPVLMPVNCNNNFSTQLLSTNYSASFFLPDRHQIKNCWVCVFFFNSQLSELIDQWKYKFSQRSFLPSLLRS